MGVVVAARERAREGSIGGRGDCERGREAREDAMCGRLMREERKLNARRWGDGEILILSIQWPYHA